TVTVAGLLTLVVDDENRSSACSKRLLSLNRLRSIMPALRIADAERHRATTGLAKYAHRLDESRIVSCGRTVFERLGHAADDNRLVLKELPSLASERSTIVP